VNAAIAIGARLFWKLADIVERAMLGSDRMSPSEISPCPDHVPDVSCCVPCQLSVTVDPADILRSVSPVRSPIGDVPATPSVSIVA